MYQICKLFVFLLLLGSTNVAFAAKKREFSKVINKEFPVTSTGTTALYNKYGKIDVKTWSENRVKIDVTIIVRSENERDAENMFDRINIDFTNTTDFVKAETNIESSKGWFPWSMGNTDYTINYEVYMPRTNQLDLRNRYGDSFIGALDNKAGIDIKYGNFRLEEITGELGVTIAYGNGTIQRCRNLSADVAYGNLTIARGADLQLNTKYSNMKIEQAMDIRSNSKYDNFKIGEIRQLDIHTKYSNVTASCMTNLIAVAGYTDFRVDKIYKIIDIDLNYGGANIGLLTKNFTDVRFTGNYADFKVNVEEGASYKLDASGNYAGITNPNGLKIQFERDKGTSYAVEGFVGNTTTNNAIKVSLNYGGAKIR
jgi:hypothetical protein